MHSNAGTRICLTAQNNEKYTGELILPFMLCAGMKISMLVSSLSPYLFDSKGLHWPSYILRALWAYMRCVYGL